MKLIITFYIMKFNNKKSFKKIIDSYSLKVKIKLK